MSSASTKIYQCSTCKDNINYNRKQYFKHIKSPEHTKSATNNRYRAKIRSDFNCSGGPHKKKSRDWRKTDTLRRILTAYNQKRAVQEE